MHYPERPSQAYRQEYTGPVVTHMHPYSGRLSQSWPIFVAEFVASGKTYKIEVANFNQYEPIYSGLCSARWRKIAPLFFLQLENIKY